MPTPNIQDTNNTRGKAGEALAEAYLQQQGLQPIARNIRSPYGEIDLIMQDGQYLVFIEVKRRNSNAFGSPIEIVTAAKQQKILQTASHYIQQQNISTEQALRFDVVGIIVSATQAPDINWIQHAFTG